MIRSRFRGAVMRLSAARERFASPRTDSSRSPDDLIADYAPGRSWVDVGCMWHIEGRDAFRAEERGATRVTAFDAMKPTEGFLAEHERRGSTVQFVRGDLHKRETLEQLGERHDVVWCSGLLYHTPFPALAVQHLAELAGEYLILGNKTLPEVIGAPKGAVFYPGLSAEEASVYAGLTAQNAGPPIDPNPFSNWWWGLTPSTTRALVQVMGRLQEGGPTWEIVETLHLPRNELEDDFFLVAKRGYPGS